MLLKLIKNSQLSNVGKGIKHLSKLRQLCRAGGVKVKWGRPIRVQQGDRVILLSMASACYILDIVGFFDYYFEAVESEAQAGCRVADFSSPRVHQLKNGTHFLFPSIPEPAATTDIYLQKAVLAPGDVVLDLGAYAGVSTYEFARAVGPDGHVYAFEPDPQSHSALQENLQRHQLTNVTAVAAGVWKYTGQISFQSEGSMGSGISEVQGRTSNLHTIDVWTLQEAMDRFQLKRLDFIKMDIEGAETAVLEHASELLKQFHPNIIVEAHKVNGTLNTQEICELLNDLGYQTEVVNQPPLDFPLVWATYLPK